MYIFKTFIFRIIDKTIKQFKLKILFFDFKQRVPFHTNILVFLITQYKIYQYYTFNIII